MKKIFSFPVFLLVILFSIASHAAQLPWETINNEIIPNSDMRQFGIDKQGNLYQTGDYTVKKDDAYHWHWFVRKSTDKGKTWNIVDDFYLGDQLLLQMDIMNSFSIDQQGNIYILGNVVPIPKKDASHPKWIIRKSCDEGKTWSTIETNLEWWCYQYAAMAIAPNGDMYAGSGDENSATIKKSTDGGKNWFVVDDWKLSLKGYSHGISSISFDAKGAIYAVGTEGDTDSLLYVRASYDNGKTWNTLGTYNSKLISINSSAIDAAGNLYIAASYSKEGDTHRHWGVFKVNQNSFSLVDDFIYSDSSWNSPRAITIDKNGIVFVTGSSLDGRGFIGVTRMGVDEGLHWTTIDAFKLSIDNVNLPTNFWGIAFDQDSNLYESAIAWNDTGNWITRKFIGNYKR